MSYKQAADMNLVGKVATNNKNIIGIITGKESTQWGESWIGERLDDGGLWASTCPKIIANSIDEYNEQLLSEFALDNLMEEDE